MHHGPLPHHGTRPLAHGGAARGKVKRQSLIRTPGRAVVFPLGELAHDFAGVLVPAQALEAGVA
jgi:hypothetical protein